MSNENELLSLIEESLSEGISGSTEEEKILIKEFSLRAFSTAFNYMQDILEANAHLRETIKRLSKEG